MLFEFRVSGQLRKRKRRSGSVVSVVSVLLVLLVLSVVVSCQKDPSCE